MTGPKRPSLAKKATRASKQKVDDALDMGAAFTIDGTEYKITTGDLSALDVRELRKQVGMSFPHLLSILFSDDDSDIDAIAAILWLARRVNGDEPDLTFDEVAAETGYDVITKIREGSEQISDPEGDKDLDSLDPED